MTAPTPGPGWTEIDPNAPVPNGAEILDWYPIPDGTSTSRRWAHIPPPPLPTDLGTVIRVPDGTAAGEWTLGSLGWTLTGGDGTVHRTADLEPEIAAFTVTAAPPAVTATAVLAAVAAAPNSYDVDLQPIAQQYGATLPDPTSPL